MASSGVLAVGPRLTGRVHRAKHCGSSAVRRSIGWFFNEQIIKGADVDHGLIIDSIIVSELIPNSCLHGPV